MSGAKDVELSRCGCGQPAKIEEFFIDDLPEPWYVATCTVCPIKTYDQTSPEEAAKIWNACFRTPSPSTEERAREAAEKILCEAGASVSIPTVREIERVITTAFATTPTAAGDSILSGHCGVDDCSHCTTPWCACECHDNGGSDLDIDGKTYQEMLEDWKGD